MIAFLQRWDGDGGDDADDDDWEETLRQQDATWAFCMLATALLGVWLLSALFSPLPGTPPPPALVPGSAAQTPGPERALPW